MRGRHKIHPAVELVGAKALDSMPPVSLGDEANMKSTTLAKQVQGSNVRLVS